MKTVTKDTLLTRLSLSHLQECSTFGAISEEGINYLLENGDILLLSDKDVLFACDDPVDCFYVVLDGVINFYKPGKGTRPHIRDYLNGHEVGFVAMIALHNRTGWGISSGESLILKVSCSLFHDLQMHLPSDFGILLLNLSREMARRLLESDGKLADNDISE